MKITDKLSSWPPDKPFYTFEYFPPKTDSGMSNLQFRLDRMASLRPAWVHITWGAGGSTQERSLQLAEYAQSMGLDVCLHLTCTNMKKSTLDDTLLRASRVGIANILALRGDPPRGEEYSIPDQASDFRHAIDLVRYIRREYPDQFCIGVAGYPEGHSDSEGKQDDVAILKMKQEAGAHFIVTQLFYDVDIFLQWHDTCRSQGITMPILPGIMPIQNYQSFRRMTNLCKTSLPTSLLKHLEPIRNDDAAVKEYGVNLSVDIIQKLYEAGIRGFHLCTLNLEKSPRQILARLGWISDEERTQDEHLPLGPAIPASGAAPPGPATLRVAALRGDANASRTSTPTSWDEFPNGRFGDARSPAYGDLDGWGVSLKLPPAEALRHWGYPEREEDISTIFARYIRGTLPAIPWSEEPLMSETASIIEQLIQLNTTKHWWTVGSQPCVDGIPSQDQTYGFGPKGGYIYQKAFVEFFARESDVDSIANRIAALGTKKMTYYASNRQGDLRTNMAPGDANAVTWGVFAGKEIVTPTLIEEESFKAWKTEAFDIWSEWQHLYPFKSNSRSFLEQLTEQRWLVSIVHHDYKDTNGLWSFLLDADDHVTNAKGTV
ncbi:uncharacterized protein L969DRAFT_46608 [Mixia osmundae IAM 14324]|uniref:MTHFR SAM-binding regulatory domain-containing protein n=1 Tax=Mixia osmundae (strain CBS 9802 / IAM 14324 / JCM 22182 / KY 12970) TaxID=764103 RepID=G7E669_MIXOS|nr:uncharacterized protein L969DRAFT_46608 [Mixia osmundae IAM 14324]KEI40517.1 hypothetical protein L969DRAFT_46608 [Mixia osmundae IAM 14324]GAA98329.1 hypothetical protein E5Q_05014 [Mixia osmundae IAM 14324]